MWLQSDIYSDVILVIVNIYVLCLDVAYYI